MRLKQRKRNTQICAICKGSKILNKICQPTEIRRTSRPGPTPTPTPRPAPDPPTKSKPAPYSVAFQYSWKTPGSRKDKLIELTTRCLCDVLVCVREIAQSRAIERMSGSVSERERAQSPAHCSQLTERMSDLFEWVFGVSLAVASAGFSFYLGTFSYVFMETYSERVKNLWSLWTPTPSPPLHSPATLTLFLNSPGINYWLIHLAAQAVDMNSFL